MNEQTKAKMQELTEELALTEVGLNLEKCAVRKFSRWFLLFPVGLVLYAFALQKIVFTILSILMTGIQLGNSL